MLSVHNLTVQYKDAGGRLFEAVSINHHEFRHSAFTVITGPSGSGKTSLLHALAGIVAPAEGLVEWQGNTVSALSESQRDGWRRKTVGYVFQDFQLIGELSPFANANLPGTFSAHKAPPGRVRALLEEFGVPISRTRASQLSRGEQQRVALARALYYDPPVILADEPTASLDEDNGALVIAKLAALAKGGKTVIAVSHDPALIKAADVRLELLRGSRVPERQK